MEWIINSAKYGKLGGFLYKWFIMKTPLPAREQLSPRVYRVLGCNPGIMTLQGTNTYLVGTGERRLLVDTGSPDHPDYVASLKTALEELKVKIDRVIITHWHADHVGGVLDLMREQVIDVATPVTKIPLPEKDDPTGLKFYPLKDGEEMAVEGATVKVLATPGHTKDHLCLLLKEERAIFSADCILGEGSSVFEDFGPYMRSLGLIKNHAPDVIYPGHGPVITKALEKVEAYIEHRLIREQQIVKSLEDSQEIGLTALEIVEKVYGNEIPRFKYPAAKINVEHHLEKLIEDGVVSSCERQDGLVGVEREYSLVSRSQAR